MHRGSAPRRHHAPIMTAAIRSFRRRAVVMTLFNRRGRAVNILEPKTQILSGVPTQMEVKQKLADNGGLWAKFRVDCSPTALSLTASICAWPLLVLSSTKEVSKAAILVVSYFVCFYAASCYWEVPAIASGFAKKWSLLLSSLSSGIGQEAESLL